MPNLTDVYLDSSYAFKYKNDVTKNSTLSIPLSRIDIGALSRYIWSPRGTWLLFVPHTHNTYSPSTSELIQQHLRERYRCANMEIMTIRIWNDGNPIRIVETGINGHSLQIAWNPWQTMLQITHIASTFKTEANPNQPNPLSQSQKHHHSLSFHSYNPLNAMKSESSPSSTQSIPNNPDTATHTSAFHLNISNPQ